MIGPWFYAGILVVLAAGWPIFLADTHPVAAVLAGIVNFGLFMFVWRACGTPACSYWRGLNVIAASMMSGCANITLLYAPIVLAGVYILSIVYAIQGFQDEQRPAGPRWERLVLLFDDRKFGGQSEKGSS